MVKQLTPRPPRAVVRAPSCRGAIDARARASIRGPRGRQHRRAHAGAASGLRLARLGGADRRSARGGERTRRGCQLEPIRRGIFRQQQRQLHSEGHSGDGRRVRRTRVARREQAPVQARLDGQPRRRRRHSRSSARRTTTRSCSASRRTESRPRTAWRPSPSSGRRTPAGTSRTRRRASPEEVPTRRARTQLAPAVAWTEAANDAGVNVSVVDVTPESTEAGTTTLAVHGLSQKQHVKKAVFATPHDGAACRLRRDRHDERRRQSGELPGRRRRADRRPSLPPEPGRLHLRQSDLVGPAALDAVQRPERLPVELPDHGRPLALLLDGDCRLRCGRERQPGDDGLPDGRRLEVPVGHPAQRRRAPTSARRRRSATTSTTRGCGAGITASTATRLSSARRARPATTSRRSRTPGTRRAATRTTSTPRSTHSATTSRLRRSPCSSATTSCTTGRTTSASTRVTGTPSSTTTASRRSTRRLRREGPRSCRSATTG